MKTTQGYTELNDGLAQNDRPMKRVLRKTHGYLKIMRYVICIGAFLMAIEGYWLATHQFGLGAGQAIYAAISVAAALAFANILNDMLDVATDRINYPKRPIPSGRVSMREATILAGSMVVLSLWFGWLAAVSMFWLALVVLAISAAYNIWLKKVPILGKIIVASLSALSLSVGYVTVPDSDLPWIPMLAALLFLLSREFLSTISDAEGDKMGGRGSIYVWWGKKPVLWLCLTLNLVAFVLLGLPLLWLAEARWLPYLLTVSLMTVLPIIVGIVSIWRDQRPAHIRFVSFHMRTVYFTSLFSFLWLV